MPTFAIDRGTDDLSPDPEKYRHADPLSLSAQGHDLTIYPNGTNRLDALCDLIDDTRETLHVFYYMFQSDTAGTRVRDRLAEAAERGVDVQLIVDRFGTDAEEEFFQPIVDNGGRFSIFSPKKSRRYLIRNHQKICVSDETIAMVGGFNISDHYFNPPPDNGWADLGVKMEGPVVQDLLKWYRQFAKYARNDNTQFRAIRRLIEEWEPGDGKVRLTIGGPTRSSNNWAKSVKRDLAKGRKLDLVMAYFSPPRSFRRLIRKLANRGEARLVMAGKSDNDATIAAARATYGRMLRRGAKIYEFQPTKLHMKLVVIDDITYFGSSNFDHRSLRLNLEMMFRFEDAGLAECMRSLIDRMQEASVHVTHDLHRERRNPWTKFKWWLGWSMVSVVDYTVTRRLNVDVDDADDRADDI
ncbi:MAG: cardiolipin synthase B [Pontixanthobacter sp.]